MVLIKQTNKTKIALMHFETTATGPISVSVNTQETFLKCMLPDFRRLLSMVVYGDASSRNVPNGFL